METLWIAIAFVCGLTFRQLGLPPLLGYLAAGYFLHAAGYEAGELLRELARVGVLLLLFSVGLKLRLASLLRLESWGSGSLHLLLTALLLVPLLRQLGALPGEQALLIAAALGFSSTVVAAKALEERRELRSFHGRVAIGILVFQDLVAVALMGYVGGHTPSPWAWALLLLPLLRRPVHYLLELSGHGELLLLYGLLLALVAGGFGFAMLGLSSELGALVVGALLSDHAKAKELADALWGLKEVFLVGFFLHLAMSGLPELGGLGPALLLALALPVKGALFFFILVALRLRARSSFLAALSLATYSEFGLILAELAVDRGWMDKNWLMLLTLMAAVSFAVAAPLNRYAHPLYGVLQKRLVRFQTARRHPDDEPITLGSAPFVIMGMGRVGTSAYDFLTSRQQRVVGLDSDPAKVVQHRNSHRRVLYADAEDPGFWENVNLENVRAVLLAMPDPEANRLAARALRECGFRGLISAAARHPDEASTITAAGADVSFDVYDEAGVGFAELVWERLYPGAAPQAASRARRATVAGEETA